MNARVEACEVKSTAARNEYILNLRAANAHLHRYHVVDIPDLIQVSLTMILTLFNLIITTLILLRVE